MVLLFSLLSRAPLAPSVFLLLEDLTIVSHNYFASLALSSAIALITQTTEIKIKYIIVEYFLYICVLNGVPVARRWTPKIVLSLNDYYYLNKDKFKHTLN